MKDESEITLMAVGDLHIERARPESIFDGVRATLGQADVLLGNQEGPVCDKGSPFPGKFEMGSSILRSCVGAVAAEAEAGFSAVSLANNHIMDYGEEGLFQTMELLEEHGIAHCGGGRSVEEAHRFVLLQRNGVSIAVLGYTSLFPPFGYAATKERGGVATVKVHTSFQPTPNLSYQPGSPPIVVTIPDAAEMETMLAGVRRARSAADLVVVQFHWGVGRGYGQLSDYMTAMGRAAVDAGADLILGHHPTRLLGFEFYRERLICYGLNHFAFDKVRPYSGWCDTVILKAIARRGRFERFSVIPAILDERTADLSVPKGERWQAIRDTLATVSGEFGTTFTAEGEELVMAGPATGTPPPSGIP